MEGNKLILSGGRVVDPLAGIDEMLDILIEGDKISAVDSPGCFTSVSDAKELSVKGMLITPGLVDIHVHLREPGQEWKETVASGAEAAVAGGFTTVCCMPNTRPVNDCAQVTEFIIEQAKKAGLAKVLPIGAISRGLEGHEMAPLAEMVEAGCVAFSDDGRPVFSSSLMRRALEYGKTFNTVLTCHEEDLELSAGFSMNESALSLEMGLIGMPEAAENVMIARDIELARLTKAPVHFCHVSTARGAELIKRAKEDGIAVTAEVTPHYLLLSEDEVKGYNTSAKMSMPLRMPEDCEALQQALSQGVIDCVASDHAPHETDSKNCVFDKASFGILGLQTALPKMLGLVRDGKISLSRLLAAMSCEARKCLKLEEVRIAKGFPADITVIDLEKKATFNEDYNRSKSVNSPFWGDELHGLAVYTIVDGRVVYQMEECRQ